MYYSGNRYLTDEEMKVNANYIYNYLTLNGWSKNAIAGILGNMQSESSINPSIWQSLNEGNLEGGFGLVQWTPATKYIDWATNANLAPAEMDSNLQRLLYEVNNNIQWGKDSDGNDPPYSFLEFTQSTEDAYILGMNFLWYYERPRIKEQPWRGEQAETWYTFIGGTTPQQPKRKKSKVFLYVKRRRSIII
jgi:hypothetical protein